LGASLEDSQAKLTFGTGAQDGNRKLGADKLDVAQDVQTTAAWKADVQNQDIPGVSFNPFEGLGGVPGLANNRVAQT
jgi:hypothetical protein